MVGTVTAAAKMAEISRDTHYAWLSRGLTYATDFKVAEAQFADRVRLEVARRALTGVRKEIYYQGVVVGHEMEYSDRMLELLAIARCEEFKPKAIVVVPIPAQAARLADIFTTKELEELRERIRARRAADVGKRRGGNPDPVEG